MLYSVTEYKPLHRNELPARMHLPFNTIDFEEPDTCWKTLCDNRPTYLHINDISGKRAAGLDQAPHGEGCHPQGMQISVGAEHLLQELRQPGRFRRVRALPDLEDI